MRRLASFLTPLCLLLGASTAAHASLTTPPPEPDPIYGGTVVGECGWPTTVHMDGCTGTLVSPEVVIFAAHCMFFTGGASPAFADLGELADVPAREVPVQGCTMFPGWVPDESMFGNDVAFCVLAEPVLDVPIVPVLMGCETDVLGPGQDITLVGYGINEVGTFGVKHEVDTVVNGFEGNEINVGGGGTSSCNGDSGGPAYVQLEDGTWRVFGITSRGTTGNCSDPSIYGLIYHHIQWIESTSGLDITPCHDSDGTWNPSDGCTEFPLTPQIGETGWAGGCAPAQLSEPSASCGDPFGGGEGSSGDTGLADTGLDDSGGNTETGLPGGTAEGGGSSSGAGPEPGGTTTGPGGTDTGDDGAQDDPDTVITCTCRSDAPAPAGALWLIPLLALARRRRR